MPRDFSRVLRQFLSRWMLDFGICINQYLDAAILTDDSLTDDRHTRRVAKNLTLCGWVFSLEAGKCTPQPLADHR